MIRIALRPRGAAKSTTYSADDIRMRECLDAYRLAEEWEQANGTYSEELMGRALSLIARCVGNGITAEELLDGYEGSPFVLIPNFLREAIGFVNDRIVDFPTRAETTGRKTKTAE